METYFTIRGQCGYSRKQHQKAAKVLLTTQAAQTDSTFRTKALRRELVCVCVCGGGGGGRGKHACFYTSEYIKTTREKVKADWFLFCHVLF